MARDPLRPPARGALVGRIVRTVLIALLVAFTVGLVIGTLLRRQLEEPVRYYGNLDERHFEATRSLQTATHDNPVPASWPRALDEIRVLSGPAKISTVVQAG